MFGNVGVLGKMENGQVVYRPEIDFVIDIRNGLSSRDIVNIVKIFEWKYVGKCTYFSVFGDGLVEVLCISRVMIEHAFAEVAEELGSGALRDVTFVGELVEGSVVSRDEIPFIVELREVPESRDIVNIFRSFERVYGAKCLSFQVAGIDYDYVDAGEDNGDFFVYSSWQFGEGDISNAFDSIGLS